MKYLKKFNESESHNISDIINDIKDIFIELEDDGYNIKVITKDVPFPKTNLNNRILIEIYKNSNTKRNSIYNDPELMYLNNMYRNIKNKEILDIRHISEYIIRTSDYCKYFKLKSVIRINYKDISTSLNDTSIESFLKSVMFNNLLMKKASSDLIEIWIEF